MEGTQPGTEVVDLSREASHHLQNVLRLKPGETVEVRDGRGNAWKAEIARIHRGCASLRLVAPLDLSFFESPLKITLALAHVRSDIMDMVVRQATEIGVAKLVAFRAARSQYSLARERAEKKVARWSKIAREAVCQCGRTRAPEIEVFEDLDRLIVALAPGGALPEEVEQGGEVAALKLFALEGEREQSLDTLKNIRRCCKEVQAVIGPEGGWDDLEIVKLIGAGFHPIRLGPRILRFETAAVALVSSIQLLWGDFGEAGQKEGEKK